MKGNGNVIGQERQTERFDRIVFNCIGNVNVYPADNYRVVVTTDGNIQDFVAVEASNNILTFTLESDNNYNPTQLEFDVFLPELRSIKLNGMGNIKISSGKTSNLEIIHSGMGNIDARDYEIENIDLIFSGMGNVIIWVTKKLSGKISGMGKVLYKGNPKIDDLKISGMIAFKNL